MQYTILLFIITDQNILVVINPRSITISYVVIDEDPIDSHPLINP